MEPWNSSREGKESVFDSLAEILKAFANGRRLELLELMAQGEHPVDALAQLSGMAVTTTSAHLQTLKRAGLVRTRRDGRTVFYRLAGDDVAELYLAAKLVGLGRSAKLRDALQSYMGEPRANGPVIDPAAVTAEMFVVDVRPVEEYEAGHFPGAVSIPLAELDARRGEVPADAEVVLYCRGEFCRMAREAATLLRERGYDAKAMDEGVLEWRATKEVRLGVA